MLYTSLPKLIVKDGRFITINHIKSMGVKSLWMFLFTLPRCEFVLRILLVTILDHFINISLCQCTSSSAQASQIQWSSKSIFPLRKLYNDILRLQRQSSKSIFLTEAYKIIYKDSLCDCYCCSDKDLLKLRMFFFLTS